jgi:hypothetical protein
MFILWCAPSFEHSTLISHKCPVPFYPRNTGTYFRQHHFQVRCFSYSLPPCVFLLCGCQDVSVSVSVERRKSERLLIAVWEHHRTVLSQLCTPRLDCTESCIPIAFVVRVSMLHTICTASTVYPFKTLQTERVLARLHASTSNERKTLRCHIDGAAQLPACECSSTSHNLSSSHSSYLHSRCSVLGFTCRLDCALWSRVAQLPCA